MVKGGVYYTDFNADPVIINICLSNLKRVFNGDIVSVSLGKPLNFGNNIVVSDKKRGYTTYIEQILLGLENINSDFVFFLENDVLYHPSHFDFVPQLDNIFYYNSNVWRWMYGSKTVVRYDRMLPLSCLCVNRKFALEHYKAREKAIKELGVEVFRSREPDRARKWGYEPGTKKKKRGGFTDDDFETWSSEYPNIDIRHDKTFSPPKITLESFKHPPVNWREMSVYDVPDWNLKQLFKI